ncbi:MAG: TraR/DksA family transcriptional regulator [Akkermansia sp.]|nr:TraR/DksA family transcriptional regulator [Akkermansia sp.]
MTKKESAPAKKAEPAKKASPAKKACAAKKKPAAADAVKEEAPAMKAAAAKPAAPKAKAEPKNTKAADKKPKPAGEKPAAGKPAAEKAKPADARKPKPEAPAKEQLSEVEKARIVKLRATMDLLKADPEWPAFLQEQKAALLKLRDSILPNMQNVTRDHLRSGNSNVSSSSGQHIGDAGSEAEVRDLTIRLLDKDREQLFEIDAALERIRLGFYGICEVSLEPIPKKRLQVRPFCRLTVKCQEEYEKKYGSYANYKAKNRDDVGFGNIQNSMENAISLDDDE